MHEKQGVNPISDKNITWINKDPKVSNTKPLADFDIQPETFSSSSDSSSSEDFNNIESLGNLEIKREKGSLGKTVNLDSVTIRNNPNFDVEENEMNKIQDLFTDKWMKINLLAENLKRKKLAGGLNGLLDQPKNLKTIEDYKSWINRFTKVERILSYINQNKEVFSSTTVLKNFVAFLITAPVKYIDSYITLFMADKELQNADFDKIKKEKKLKEQILIADNIEKIRNDAKDPLLQLNEAKIQTENVQEEGSEIQRRKELDDSSEIKLPSINNIRNWDRNTSRNPVLDKLLAEEFGKQGFKSKEEKELARTNAQNLLSARIKQQQAEEDEKKKKRKEKREARKAEVEARKKQEEKESLQTKDLALDLSAYKKGLEKKKNKKQEEVILKNEIQEKKENLITGRQKLIFKYDLALNRFNLELAELEEKIVLLENRMNFIKGINSNKFNFEDDKDLVSYGDLCRELTFIIQDLNELDSKKAKMNVLAKKYKIRFNIIKNNERLSAELGEEEKGWLNELDIDVKNQAELSVVVGKNAYELTFDTSSNNFGRLHHDQKSSENLNQYIAQQWNWVDSPKEISLADKEKISNIFAMDWLKKHVDPVTLANNTKLRRKINNSNNPLLLDIYKKHGMILPTEKAGVPLYFKDGQALVPSSYIDKVYTKFGKSFSKLKKSESHTLIEAILYEKILTDPQVSLRQAMLISHRLNKLLGESPKLKKWIKLSDQKDNYKFLKVKKGWFHRIPIKEIKDMIENEGEGMLKTAFEIKESKLPEDFEDREVIVTDDMLIEEKEIGNEIKKEVKFPVVEKKTEGLENQMAKIEDDYTNIAKELEVDEKRRMEVEEKQDEFVNHYLLYHFGLDAWKKKELSEDSSLTQAQKNQYKKNWSPGKIAVYKNFIKNDVRELLRGMGNSSGKQDAHSFMRMINFLKDYTKKIKSEDHKDHKKYEKYKYLVNTLLKPVE